MKVIIDGEEENRPVESIRVSDDGRPPMEYPVLRRGEEALYTVDGKVIIIKNPYQ
ncbi:MAG: hypothetical protein JRC53_01110 [Deltaproteobacteria bacterium]|nr:hypothetical protein [Deltaproteobacteria bacterium]